MFNFFSPEDLTLLNQEAKQHIREKIPASGLMDTAKNEVLQAVLLIEKIVVAIGWKNETHYLLNTFFNTSHDYLWPNQ